MLIVNMTSIRVENIKIDYVQSVVYVFYSILDSDGESWKSDTAIFWVVMPEQTPIIDDLGNIVGYEPYPKNWYTISQNYIELLINMKNDTNTVITSKVLG